MRQVIKHRDIRLPNMIRRSDPVIQYQVPVRQASDLPKTSFRPNVTIGTLALAVRLPLLGCARDLHPLDYAHVGRT